MRSKKKLLVAILGVILCCPSNAQLAVGGFMDNTEIGKTFEKVQYESNEKSPVFSQWVCAWSYDLNRSAKPPVAGKELSWPGYGEKGNSIEISSGFPSGIHGQRFTSYVFSRSITSGILYMAFIIRPDIIKNRKFWTQMGFCTSVYGGGYHCGVCFYPESQEGVKYNIGVRLKGTMMVVDEVFEVGQKHLIVIKYNLDSNYLSIFIDPDLSKPEPIPNETAYYTPSDKDSRVCGIRYRDVSDNKGNIGNFRVARVWEDIR